MAKSALDDLKQLEKEKEPVPDDTRELISLELKDIKRWPRVRITVAKWSTPRTPEQVSCDNDTAGKLRISAGLGITTWLAV